jgi:hypothetical protein
MSNIRGCNRILKGALHGEVVDDVVAKVAMSEVDRRGRQKSVDLERVECIDT